MLDRVTIFPCKIHAHDETNECSVGDLVTVQENRPISKTKTWVLASIDERVVSAGK